MNKEIHDHQGNSFAPSKDQAALAFAGWRIVERKKQGCFWIVKWADNNGGMVWPQGTAIQILKDRQKRIKK